MNDSDPGRHIGFLVHEVGRLMRRNFDQRVSHLGLTQAQWKALVHLRRNQGCSQVDLAETLEVKPITLARLLDRLEHNGWIERQRDPTDRRAFRLFLTPQSKPMLDEIEKAGQATRKEALRGLSEQDQVKLMDMLNTIKRNLLPHNPIHQDSET